MTKDKDLISNVKAYNLNVNTKFTFSKQESLKAICNQMFNGFIGIINATETLQWSFGWE